MFKGVRIMYCKAEESIYNKDNYCIFNSIIILTLGLCKEILYNSTPNKIINTTKNINKSSI